ncbi:MAG: hypothetical protein KME32_30705 [Mojavia pulchra JT2-VF2]|jgi:hypothetical protein|uniref:Uncharacterized protein n=1 Tax=Mojavia pulchra JT2-VF2 TaxID=287848 RepID=A0A951Q5Y3_9NOST|nr:hypothetical protein [Mojavia pulchra JT2-VF2]
MTYSDNQKLTTEDVEVTNELFKNSSEYQDLSEQGQQDDYFDADLNRARNAKQKDTAKSLPNDLTQPPTS